MKFHTGGAYSSMRPLILEDGEIVHISHLASGQVKPQEPKHECPTVQRLSEAYRQQKKSLDQPQDVV